MKLTDLLLEKKAQPGTYIGAKFTSDTVARLKKFVKDNDIPNGLKAADFHTTIIYSRVHVDDLEAQGKLKDKWVGKPVELDIFKTQNGWKALVLRYSCKEQEKRHKDIMDSTNATYDYPEYKVHLTLSYNIEDRDEEELKKLSLDSIGDIIIASEYKEDLNLDFAEKTVKKKD